MEQAQQAPPPEESESDELNESEEEQSESNETYKQRINEMEKEQYTEYIARKRQHQRKLAIKLQEKRDELHKLIKHKRMIDDRLEYITDEEGSDRELDESGDPDFDPDFDSEFDYNFNSKDNKKEKFNFQSIPQKVAVYDGLLETINEELMAIKNGLDSYEMYLHKINSFVQLSVIILSVASSFVQALNSKTYEIIFGDPITDPLSNPNSNITEIIENTIGETSDNVAETNGAMDQDTYSKIVPVVTLSISTYSALVISTERHFSFEAREGNVNNLKGLYAELISRIRYQRELLDPWKLPDYYQDQSTEKKRSWYATVKNIDQEYCHIIDIKRELFTAYEKIVNTGVYDKYRELFNKDGKSKKRSLCCSRKKHSSNPPSELPPLPQSTQPPSSSGAPVVRTSGPGASP